IDMLAPSLSAAGYHVIAVASIEEAKSYLRPDHTFDAVLIGASLRDHFEVQAQMADIKAPPPIVEFSDSGEARSHMMGASEFYERPSKFDRYAILERLTRAIAQRQAAHSAYPGMAA